MGKKPCFEDFCLRYSLLPHERVPILQQDRDRDDSEQKFSDDCMAVGSKELACGSQAFTATLPFDPSMSALLIIASQLGQSARLFTF